ncbi:ABC transporter G family member 7 [Pelomyxa schiedti]|nr:ABC transporter G family member 7 [Pelomyxa schiedti]
MMARRGGSAADAVDANCAARACGTPQTFVVSERLSLDFKDVKYTYHEKSILKAVSGSVPAGSLLAIMGPSGSGKTTLLDILAGRQKRGKVQGVVQIGGVNPTRSMLTDKCGYVMSDDVFLPRLTVQETLRYTAELRLANISRPKMDDLVNFVIKLTNLTKVANTKVGTSSARGISSGERRRLSIAMELLVMPSVLFVDEPTTGLDAINAMKVMTCLRKLADAGCTVVVALHQPRSTIFNILDYILLLHEGFTVYFGRSGDVVPHFNSLGHKCPPFTNPAVFD